VSFPIHIVNLYTTVLSSIISDQCSDAVISSNKYGKSCSPTLHKSQAKANWIVRYNVYS